MSAKYEAAERAAVAAGLMKRSDWTFQVWMPQRAATRWGFGSVGVLSENVKGLSYADAWKRAVPFLTSEPESGRIVRLISGSADYCEVWSADPSEEVRCGTLAETTRVTVVAQEGGAK